MSNRKNWKAKRLSQDRHLFLFHGLRSGGEQEELMPCHPQGETPGLLSRMAARGTASS